MMWQDAVPVPINPSEATQGISYLVSAGAVVLIQKWLKRREIYQRFLTAFPGTDRAAHWTFAGVASLVAATGVHVVWHWDMLTGGQAVIQMPSLSDMVHGFSDWAKVMILQHLEYLRTTRGPGGRQGDV